MTAVMRIAEARLKASSMSKSSIKLLLPGAEVDCSTKTSAPRTFSLISTLLSPSLKVSTVAFPSGTLRYWLISAAKGGLELPANIFSSAVCMHHTLRFVVVLNSLFLNLDGAVVSLEQPPTCPTARLPKNAERRHPE